MKSQNIKESRKTGWHWAWTTGEMIEFLPYFYRKLIQSDKTLIRVLSNDQLIEKYNTEQWFRELADIQLEIRVSKFSEEQRRRGILGGLKNWELNSESLLESADKWRKENPEKHRHICSLGGVTTWKLHRGFMLEVSSRGGKTNVESGHLERVRDTDKMLLGANRVIKCPHCPKEGQLANMRRWHFENCKYIKS